MSDHYYPARAVVYPGAIRHNTSVLAAAAPTSQVMTIVKADAYGHGLVPVAEAALLGGATWLGVAQTSEALALRAAGIDAPILTWLYGPDAPFEELLLAGIDISVASVDSLARVQFAAMNSGTTARIHVKVDTGLGRGGVSSLQWSDFVQSLGYAVSGQGVEVIGIWSHLAFGDEPGHPFTQQQVDALIEASSDLKRAGIDVPLRHIAASGATLREPNARLDLVRPGIATYGLTPFPEVASAEELGLEPAMRLIARLTTVKPVPAGQGVSYGHHYVTPRETVLGVVPVGYADGIPRHVSGLAGNPGAPIRVLGPDARDTSIAGRVCMDQVVIDLGPQAQEIAGDEVVLFGDPALGEPSAQDWAQAAGTINYEITTRLGPRIPRVYVAETPEGTE
ncbi:alanine racemase [Rarobacter faecitabidus]|uniref:Alanine racemase n=1 Tax=Rarobacter faecitabidus TaxID=13243 RepID=A0A542ZXV8_RARFA|nr:alanine racemase [Rarobacter faecitabidus]TQL65050.1 alanine racemase [Rarobacter faecitabidus]